MNALDMPCRCGHPARNHWNMHNKKPKTCYFNGMTSSDRDFIRSESFGCICDGYQLDNLRYLEMMYDAQS